MLATSVDFSSTWVSVFLASLSVVATLFVLPVSVISYGILELGVLCVANFLKEWTQSTSYPSTLTSSMRL